MLKGKTVILGITGSIAAYKMANVAQLSEEAKKQIADVIGSLQYAAPYVYMDRLRKMRIRLEISAIHV